MEAQQIPGPREQHTEIAIPAPVVGDGTAAEASVPNRSLAAQKQHPAGPSRPPRGGWLTRRRLVWAAATAAILGLIVLSMRPTPLEVETAQAETGPLEVTVDADGVTRLHDRFLVSAPVTGRVERISVREGDPVEAGALLARVSPLPLDPQATAQAQARVAAARSAVDEAEARVAQAREMLEQTERSTARVREVAQAGAMSVDALERAELQLASAAREHQAAQSRARLVRAEVAAAEAALLDVDPARSTGRAVAELRSPAAGRVLRVHERSERIVGAGTPLVEVGDASALEVVVDVLSTDAVRIPVGAAVRLAEWGGEGVLQGRVRRVEPSGFTKVSTLGVEEQRVFVLVDLLDPPPALGDGYRIEARIVTWEDPQVLKVPRSALFRSGSDWQLFVVEGGRAQLRTVGVGHRGTTEAEILVGLRRDETVILFPSDRLRDGARVSSP